MMTDAGPVCCEAAAELLGAKPRATMGMLDTAPAWLPVDATESKPAGLSLYWPSPCLYTPGAICWAEDAGADPGGAALVADPA